LLGQASFPRIVKTIGRVPIYMFIEEVAVHAGFKVQMEVDYIGALIVDVPYGILGQQLRHHQSNYEILL
jgi:hypothetical protein